ncbi:MAG TPA: glycoside hydrolase family 20 zincin-like fold domain-containing protein [Candidatus Sulfotelmatobacter sp.]|nr:glycoside hydrolase family 20 zincin-like fold domain-containing protein [Candidatus Sulfotelmatobacter sp.]
MSKLFRFLLLVTISSSAVWAIDSGTHAALNLVLVPSPREVQLREGGFRLGPHTRILVQLGHQQEDRIAAETLAEQIADQSGFKLDIVGTKASTKADRGAIMLMRLQDARVRHFLAEKGLQSDASLGKEGYVLFSDNSHLIVAANTGEGLFSGVQTLRQLLRTEGKDLICPAVTIRDWPALEKTENTTSRSNESGTELVMRFRGPAE